jgi:PST family polysaccharide transporter
MLREKVVSGGIILTIRTILGVAISVVGNVIILRFFDPKTYGLYSLAFYWVVFFSGYIIFGIHTYLARTQETITDRLVGSAFTLFLIQALIGTLFVFGVLSPLLSWFYAEGNLSLILCLLSLSYVLNSFGKVSLSLLERDLEYKKLGIIELSSQIFYYIPAVTLALFGFGIIALVLAELTRSLVISIMALFFRRVKFKLLWDKKLSPNMLKYGFGITTAGGIYGINTAIVPILVGKLAGTEAVGIIRVTQNIVGQLSFLQSIAWRISIPALGRIQHETQKVIKVISEGALYQVFLVAFPLFGFISIGYWLVPLLFGEKWGPVSEVLILACLPVAVNAIFSLQASALFAKGKNFEEIKFTTAYTMLLWPVAFLTISKFGYMGLPLAEILVFPTYYVQHYVFKKNFGNPKYKNIFAILGISYMVAVLAWFVKIPWVSLMIFTIPTFIVILSIESSKDLILELIHHFRSGALKQSLFSLRSR